MPDAQPSRKQLFRAALAIAGLTAAQWADRESITPEHLSRVLNSRRESGTLIEKIDAFIAEKLPDHAPSAATVAA
jgi:hypothetical protein